MKNCPNCSVPVKTHTHNGCVLHELMCVISDRGNLTKKEVRAIHAYVDADALWNDLGAIVDRLEEGGYAR